MVRKIKQDGRVYERRMIDTAIEHAPEIYPCANCGSPVARGYCCGYCGDNNPSETRGRTKTTSKEAT